VGASYTSLAQSIDALRPIFDERAEMLFGVGLFGASFLAAFILPLATAYAVCEAFGLEYGLDRSLGEAPFFFGTYGFVLISGMVGALCMADSLFFVILAAQVANGILLLPILCFMVMLARDGDVMGAYQNSHAQDSATLFVLMLLSITQAGLLLALF
jgi:Mn2+/Fe2+ NRAMP family transporter